ncbi:hypothetical protein KQI41_12795 [Tissierella pigra]|uniref:Uncharacterized protein n=1 Tax=Tissierella pigra TaxID=2607614 RepID=A0A6N7XQJ4_9FIRM|nr:hypothetical protein [Tissierella pigra]MBU5427290.1 hypothetical protein [Tissierella pigra]MSU03082.1 hypothetical protein [Tissierella pigra]
MTELEKNISFMKDYELKEKIIYLNTKQLNLIKKSSYLNVFNGVTMLKNTLKDNLDKNETESNIEISSLENYLNKAINLIEDSICNDDEEKKQNRLIEAINIRQELYELASIIDGYSIELSYVRELVDYYGTKIITKKDYEKIPYNNMSVEELIKEVNNLLDNQKQNYFKYINIISNVISVLPMRLTKDKYFNIVQNTIMRNLKLYTKPEAENQINEYKKQFDSSLRNGYGTKFDYCFREIQKLRHIDLSNKSLEEIDEVAEKIVSLNRKIDEMFNFILQLGLISNLVIVINLINDNKIEEIEEVYRQWKKSIIDGNRKYIEDSQKNIEKKIKQIEKDMLGDLEEFNILNSEAISRETFDYEKLNEDLLYTKKVLTYYNDFKLTDHKVLFPEDGETVGADYLEQIVDSLIQYINRSLGKMTNIERKIRMRKLLSQIELPFRGIEEFNDYIRYSLDIRVVPKEEINFTIDYILYFIDNLPEGK